MKLLSTRAALAGSATISICTLLSAAVCHSSYVAAPESAETNHQEGESPDIEEAFSDAVEKCGLHVEARTIDFGSVYEGTKSTYPLKMKNTSDHLIEVIGANASCGCTTVQTETPFSLKPGEERALTIQMNSSNNVGDMEKIVTVFVAEGESRFKFPVSVKARSIPLIHIDRREIDFGMVAASETTHMDVGIVLNFQSDDSSKSAPVSIAAAPAGVTAKLIEVEAPEGAARQWKLDVAVDGKNVPEESIDGDLILITPSTVESVVRIPVRARQHALVSCETGRVNFGAVRKESDLVESVRLSCPAGHEYNVTGIEIEDRPDFLTAEFDAEHSSVLVKIDPADEAKGFFKTKLRVRYSCDQGPRQTLVIPVVGYRMASVR